MRLRLGLTSRDAAVLAIGALLGWAGARLVIPTPVTAFLSPRVVCGGSDKAAYLVSVPFAANASWSVRAGSQWWDPKRSRWAPVPAWNAGPGKVLTTPVTDGVQIVVHGFQSGQVAGASIQGLLKKE